MKKGLYCIVRLKFEVKDKQETSIEEFERYFSIDLPPGIKLKGDIKLFSGKPNKDTLVDQKLI